MIALLARSGKSRPVTSNQEGVHADLERTVRRHLGAPFARPIGEATRVAYSRFLAHWQGGARPPLIFDSGCGVGESTRFLAAHHGDALVVGIDKSADRLHRGHAASGAGGVVAEVPPNMLLVRADLVDFWRLAHADGLCLAEHYLLYPNPWPKSAHLQRRWHGHAVFPTLLALGGRIELRSNWRIYVEEFLRAARLAGAPAATLEAIPESELSSPLTPFERKYHASGQPLYRASFHLATR